MNQFLIEKVNKRFDYQISNSKIKYNLSLNKINKKLFNLSLKLDLNDWRKIRKGDFWEKIDKLDGDLKKHIFTLLRINIYLKEK